VCLAAGLPVAAPAPAPAKQSTPVAIQALTERWERLSQRAMRPPRTIGVIDHTGSAGAWTEELRRAAHTVGATAYPLDPGQQRDVPGDLDTVVIVSPPATPGDLDAACAQVRSFFADRTWWPATAGTPTDVWLVTVGAEYATAEDPPPALAGAALAAGFRSFGAEFPESAFNHVDLPAGVSPPSAAAGILSAVHTKGEPEIAVREDGLYVKRIVEGPPAPGDPENLPYRHVVIFGGTGNLGLEFCEHFLGRGTHRITLVSRSGQSTTVTDRLRRIGASAATQVDVAECDLTDEAAVAAFAERHRATPADLIIHAALAYDDADSAEITPERADGVLGAKVLGIGRVMAAFPRTDDCRVVLCSSVAATIGGRGQILYAAANRMLDAFAHHLRARGVDCIAVQWGQWTTVSLDAAGAAKLAATGMVPMAPEQARAVGITRLTDDAVVAAFDLAVARPVMAAYGYGPLLSQLPTPTTTDAVAAPRTGGDKPEQRLKNLLAGTIGLGSDAAIDTDIPMVAIGLDSLQALEFRRRVHAEFNYELDVTDLLGGASITDLATRIGG
ncbi:beta-ketoacyl reductase, partial [Mycolicibacillus koreensis]|uniref:beta-ketoacyl reductase n=1 Tax=Mycolicibacillus koreensis TaxID=1069220 RepID=UPI001055613D